MLDEALTIIEHGLRKQTSKYSPPHLNYLTQCRYRRFSQTHCDSDIRTPSELKTVQTLTRSPLEGKSPLPLLRPHKRQETLMLEYNQLISLTFIANLTIFKLRIQVISNIQLNVNTLAMEEARKALFEKVIKRYTLREVARHATLASGSKNLLEMITRYPGFGSHFKVSKRTWPENSFYHVTRMQLFGGRYGRLYGLKYWNGELVSDKFEKIPRVLQRGMWRFDPTDPAFTPQQVQLDNGNTYDLGTLHAQIEAKQALLRGRKAAMEYRKVAAEAE